jgi:hypothetical protein
LDWALDFYGGRTDEEYKWNSNIFLSNGMVDPWVINNLFYFILKKKLKKLQIFYFIYFDLFYIFLEWRWCFL